MQKFKGTTGPWSRSGNAVFNDDGYAIVHLTYGEYTGIKEDEANTKLIAAAPELLEALQDMLSGWQYIRQAHGDLYGVGWDRAEQKAKDALSKALGQ